MRASFRLFTAFLIAIVLDIFSKWWVQARLVPHQPLPVVGDFFQLTLAYNSGVAFGMFANGGSTLLFVTAGIILGLVVGVVYFLQKGHLTAVMTWAAGLILGGAVANFVDRASDGRVTDFLDVGLEAVRWPTFNLADTAIVLGVLLVMWVSLTEKDLPEREP